MTTTSTLWPKFPTACEFAAFLEDATHQKLDEAALQQAVAHSGRTLELLQQAQAAKAGRNLHNDVTSEFYEVFVTPHHAGHPAG